MDLEVGSVEEVVDNGSDTDVDVDDSGSPSSVPHLSSAQLLMQATQANHRLPLHRPKGKLIAVSPHKAKHVVAKPVVPKPPPQSAKQASSITQAPKQPNIAQTAKQASATQAVKQIQINNAKTNVTPQLTKPAPPPPKLAVTPQSAKTIAPVPKPPPPSPKQTLTTPPKANLMAQSAKQANVIAQLTKQTLAKQGNVIQSRQVNVVKPPVQSPKSSAKQPATPKVVAAPKQAQKQENPKVLPAKPVTPVVPTPHKSPLIKQRPLLKQVDASQVAVSYFYPSLSIRIL